jgi:hypothetical protein
MRRLVAITLQDVAANPRKKTKGLTARAKREARIADRPRWLYQRRRRTEESALGAGAASLPELVLSDHEQLTLEDLFSPAEDEFAWGLFSPEPDVPGLPVEPGVEGVPGHVRSLSAGFATQAGSSASLMPSGLRLYSAGLATQASATASSSGPAVPAVLLVPVEDVEEVGPQPERLSRVDFPSQAAWHLEVARQALVGQGHVFGEPGSIFDPAAERPKAPQCDRCLLVFPKSRVHALSKTGEQCMPVAVCEQALAKPQRLMPQGVLRLGALTLDESHSLGHYRGRVWCFSCAATMAVTARVTTALLSPCLGRCEVTARRNVERLAEGELPKAWQAAGWPKGAGFRLLVMPLV